MVMGPWELPDEELLETAQRLSRAEEIPQSSVYTLDTEAETAVIIGRTESAYSVSLEECDCSDFERRGLPCKHMIRLALELGYKFDIPQFDPIAAADYDVQEDIDRLMERWHSGQLTLDALTKCISALRSSASKAKKRKGRPKKSVDDPMTVVG